MQTIEQLIKVKKSIEHFFYKMRYNVGLEAILSSQMHESFRRKLENSLKDQMLYYAKFEKVNSIIGLQKSQYEAVDDQLKSNLNKIWLPIVAILDEEDTRKYYEYVAKKAGQATLDSITSGSSFTLTNKSLYKKLDMRIKEFPEIIDNTTKDWITRRIEQGLSGKMNAFDIAKMLRDDASDVAFNRSITISEQETALIYGQIVKEVYKRNEITQVKWVTAKDERVCEICSANEALGVLTLGKKFANGVTEPPAHVNCRCFILPAMEETKEIKWTGQ